MYINIIVAHTRKYRHGRNRGLNDRLGSQEIFLGRLNARACRSDRNPRNRTRMRRQMIQPRTRDDTSRRGRHGGRIITMTIYSRLRVHIRHVSFPLQLSSTAPLFTVVNRWGVYVKWIERKSCKKAKREQRKRKKKKRRLLLLIPHARSDVGGSERAGTA